jgi:uncharacterized membrane protein (DUF2068 family)
MALLETQTVPVARPQGGSEASAEPVLAAKRPPNSGGLLLVGLYKLSKAIFFGAMGAGALHLIHHNFGDFVMGVVDRLPIDPESHFVGLIMDRADLVNHHELRQFSMATFAYSVTCLIEGTGLMRRKVWAEYLTTILTAMALPWETYELIHHFTWLKVGVILVNLGVLIYLLWVLKQKRQQGEVPA